MLCGADTHSQQTAGGHSQQPAQQSARDDDVSMYFEKVIPGIVDRGFRSQIIGLCRRKFVASFGVDVTAKRTMSLSSDEINYLIYRYLQENGKIHRMTEEIFCVVCHQQFIKYRHSSPIRCGPQN